MNISVQLLEMPLILPTIQIQIVDVLSDQVKQQIIQKVKAAKWYTVIADEVTDDVSNKEQLSVVLRLRYVESDTLVVREDLVCFTECDAGTSGHALAEKITCTLEGYGLDLSNLHGQAYDGARNIAWLV